MKNIKKRLSSIIALAIIALLSLTLLFSSLISDGISVSGESTGETLGDSGITFNGDTYTADITWGTGETYKVSTVDEFKTAVSTVAAGDVIELAAGTYTISAKWDKDASAAVLIEKSGSHDAYITIKAASGAEGSVIFDFSGLSFDSNGRGIQFNADYWYIYGISVTGAGDNGMYIAGSYNVVENCQFYGNRDTGLQLGRAYTRYTSITDWPSYNLIKNCTSYNNYDNETYGENADGFAAKLTVGYGNVFDGCIAYRNSDDGWDLYAYADNGDIGAVIIYNCVAFENGYLMTTQEEFNNSVTLAENFNTTLKESNTNKYSTRDGDGNGFKLGGSVMRGNVKLYNCLAFSNRMHGVTDNSNPGILNIEGVTSYNNGAAIDNDSDSDTFGQIIVGSVDDDYGNFNTARTESSYNNYKNNLSIADGYRSDGLGADDFLGSAQNTVFYMGSNKYNYIGDAIDASSYSSGEKKVGSTVKGWVATTYDDDGKEVDTTGQIDSAEVFEQLPFTTEVKYYDAEGNEVESTADGATAKTVYTYNITGLNNTSIHTTYRNAADGSINMGTMLKIKDTSKAYELGVGAYLSETEWGSYTHYYDVSVSNGASSTDATLIAIYNTLYLYCNTDAVYQDFILTSSMTGATISWTSSNSDIIEVGTTVNTSNSGSQDVDAIVYRPDEDTQVTLTATITYNDKTCTKTFTVTVKADDPSIGDMYAEGEDEGRILIDQYLVYSEPELVVTNAADYNGKTLKDGTYTVESTYEYATSATAAYSKVGAFTSSAAGVYRITKTVTLTTSGEKDSYTYYIYVASNDAVIDFTDGTGTLAVYSEGYSLSGDLTNIKGSIYAYSTSTALDLSSYTTAAEQAAYISTLEGVESYSFTDSSISYNFTNSNSSAYTVYYWFTNGNGVVTSDVHTQNVTLVEVGTTDAFDAMLSSASSSSATTIIYLVTADLDFDGITLSNDGKNFYALLNGGGHTVSNITIEHSSDENAGLIGKLMGGTIMNIRFLNLTITNNYSGSNTQNAGLIARSYGGYIYQVALENATISASDRVGGIVGYDRANITYVDQVSVTGSITSSGNRAGGIMGHMQLDSSYSTVGMVITNCYVSADVAGGSSGSYIGGIVGRFDDATSAYSLSISNCYVTGNISCSYNYAGGILGGQSGGAGSLTISGCVFLGTLTFKGEVLTEAQKNASGMIGRYAQYAGAIVENCYAVINEYFSEYTESVDTLVSYMHRLANWNTAGYDVSADGTSTWLYLESYAKQSLVLSSRYQDEEENAYAPFVVLQFLVENNWADVIVSSTEAERISVNASYTTWANYGYTLYGITDSSEDTGTSDSSDDSTVTE